MQTICCLLKYHHTDHGPYPQYGWDFPQEIPENSGKTPETLSERFLEFPSRVRLGSPKPYNSRHLRLPEHFQNSLPPERASQSWSWKFPAVLRVFLRSMIRRQYRPSCQTFKSDNLGSYPALLPSGPPEASRFVRVNCWTAPNMES